jgi:hypothetical protein
MYYVVARMLVAWGRAVGVLDHGIAIYQSVLYFPAMNAQPARQSLAPLPCNLCLSYSMYKLMVWMSVY